MENINIMEIATRKVLTIRDDESVAQAIDKMYAHNHRDIVVISEGHKKFGLLSAVDLIKLKKENFDFDTKISSILYHNIEMLSPNNSLKDGFNAVKNSNSPICIVDENGVLVGFVTYYDLISAIDPSVMIERRMIGELFIGTQLKKLPQESPLNQVIYQLDNTIYDCVILTDEQFVPVGIITTKDVIRLFKENINLDEQAKKYMVSPLVTVSYDISIKKALVVTNEKHFKRLIVTDHNGEIIGQVTREELLSKVLSRWAEIMKQDKNDLEEVNRLLVKKTSDYEMIIVVDQLTRIYNRGKFEHELFKEIERIKRYNSESFSLIFFDIDNFKNVNDTHGHLVGDHVLVAVAQMFKGLLRTTDIIARWGGEEFVVIMYNTDLDHALLGAEKLRRAIEDKHIRDVGYITCSFGVTEYIKGDSVQSIVLRADSLMYEAKKQGKNRVVTS